MAFRKQETLPFILDFQKISRPNSLAAQGSLSLCGEGPLRTDCGHAECCLVFWHALIPGLEMLGVISFFSPLRSRKPTCSTVDTTLSKARLSFLGLRERESDRLPKGSVFPESSQLCNFNLLLKKRGNGSGPTLVRPQFTSFNPQLCDYYSTHRPGPGPREMLPGTGQQVGERSPVSLDAEPGSLPRQPSSL